MPLVRIDLSKSYSLEQRQIAATPISLAASVTLILLAARSCNTLIRSIPVRLTVIGPIPFYGSGP